MCKRGTRAPTAMVVDGGDPRPREDGMETRKRFWIVALCLVLALSGVAWADPVDGGGPGEGAPSVWEQIWSEITGWLFGLDGSEGNCVGEEGQSNEPPGPPAPAPTPPSTQSEGDHGGSLDPNG